MTYVRAAALVSGYPAWKFAQLLERAVGELDCRSDLREECERQLQAVRSAGEEWRASVRDAVASGVRSAEVPRPVALPLLDAMTSAQVAEVLQVSTRQVLNLADRLGGRQARRGAPWLFSRAEVLAYLKERDLDR